MAKFVWSVDPLALNRMRSAENDSPLTAAELAALDIPPRKIPRVQAELARLNADTQLERAVLPDLARQIARQLL